MAKKTNEASELQKIGNEYYPVDELAEDGSVTPFSRPAYTYASWHTFDPKHPRNFEHPTGESVTVPDMTLSIAELLARATRGQNVPHYEGVYEGDNDLPDIERMDAMERLDYARSIREQIANTRSELAQAASDKAAEAAAAKEAADQAAAEELQKFRDQALKDS